MAGPAQHRGRVLRLLRTLHAWLGIFIFPWVIVIGATGFYLNHARAILPALQGQTYDESRFGDWPGAAPVGAAAARRIAEGEWPGEPITKVTEITYHGRPSFKFRKWSGLVIVSRPTGHYFVKTAFHRRTYAPDGTLLHSKFYWSSFFKRLHERGWFDSSLGTWLADLTSLAMVLFGISGVVLWWMPRSRRILRAAARLRP